MTSKPSSPPPADTAAPALKATWFDGSDSRGQRALAMIEPGAHGPELVIAPLDPQIPGVRLSHKSVHWPQTYGSGDPKRRLSVNLRDYGTLQVDSAAQWHAAYNRAGGRRKMAERLQTSWKILAGFTAACALLLFVFYRYGTPWAATQLARFVPVSWETRMTEEVIPQLDQAVFTPSQLPAARQAVLQERFAAMLANIPPALQRYSGYTPLWRLEFRQGNAIGANALALPGGLLIMTDEMVELADRHRLGNEALLGVLAHEIGHIVHRHSSRMLIEQGVLNATLSIAMGDVSSIVAIASTGLTTLAYSRDHEREADCFALALMRHQNSNPKPLGQLFAALQGGGASQSSPAVLGWLSTHPDTTGRIAIFRNEQPMQCDTQTGRLR